MYKGSIELGKINKYMKIKFNIIIKDDENKNSFNMKVIDTFTYGGSEYLRLSPKPYITIDISATADKTDSWNSNTQVNLNKMCLIDFIIKSKNMINKFRIPELYFIKNNRLQVNTDIANKSYEIIRTPNKTIKMIHCVVYDNDNSDIENEGICFMINSIDNFCFLTYTELEYLYYMLSKINMDELAISLINTYLLIKDKESRKLEIQKTIDEIKINEPQTISLPKLELSNEIPDNI